MYQTSLHYESNGMDNFSVLDETLFYKCPICGHHHFMKEETRRKVFISGQKIKGVPVEVD
jgi:DNA-directed RNA polymerase subunit RPC12/RpoP